MVGNNYFKLGNCLLKKNDRDFLKIALKVGKRDMCGPRLFF